jgi:hypothetical protein
VVWKFWIKFAITSNFGLPKPKNTTTNKQTTWIQKHRNKLRDIHTRIHEYMNIWHEMMKWTAQWMKCYICIDLFVVSYVFVYLILDPIYLLLESQLDNKFDLSLDNDYYQIQHHEMHLDVTNEYDKEMD